MDVICWQLPGRGVRGVTIDNRPLNRAPLLEMLENVGARYVHLPSTFCPETDEPQWPVIREFLHGQPPKPKKRILPMAPDLGPTIPPRGFGLVLGGDRD